MRRARNWLSARGVSGRGILGSDARGRRRGSARIDRRLPGCGQHSIHLRHHRIAEGRAADASQPGQQRTHHRRTGCAVPSTDRLCSPVPLYHCFGCVIGTMAVRSASGADDDSARAQFDPLATMQAIHAERAPRSTASPPCSSRSSASRIFALRFLSLRTGVMAGAPCPIEVMKRVVERHALPADDDHVRSDRIARP